LNIVYISQYFPPEMGAPAARVYELSRAWAKKGHKVTVLTGFPHHPTGVLSQKYRGRVLMRESVDGITLLRTYVYATPNKAVVKRTLSYLSFMFSAVLFAPFLLRDPDLIIATSPQFFTAIAGFLISKMKHRPFIFEVRDLWPESIVTVGAMRNRLIISLLEKLEMFLYRKSTGVVGVADSTKEILIQRGIPQEKIRIIKNGVDLSMFKPGLKENWVREKYGLSRRFIVSYIGTIGMAHSLEVVLRAADELQNQENIIFLFVGEGARKDKLIQIKQDMNLTNVLFLGGKPRELIPDFLTASDVCLVHLKKAALFKAVVPSKVFEIMGAGRPIILGLEGECEALIRSAGAGLFMEPENSDQLAQCIMRLYKDKRLREDLGKSGRRYVEKNFSRDQLAAEYENMLKKICNTGA